MMRRFVIPVVAMVAIALTAAAYAADKAKTGDAAPAFSLQDQNGKTVSLADQKAPPPRRVRREPAPAGRRTSDWPAQVRCHGGRSGAEDEAVLVGEVGDGVGPAEDDVALEGEDLGEDAGDVEGEPGRVAVEADVRDVHHDPAFGREEPATWAKTSWSSAR